MSITRIAAEMAALRPPKHRQVVGPEVQAARVEAPPLPDLSAAPAADDDLEIIDGIGPTYARRLRALGITTFAALAEASNEVLDQVAGTFADRVRREDWRGQALRLIKRE